MRIFFSSDYRGQIHIQGNLSPLFPKGEGKTSKQMMLAGKALKARKHEKTTTKN
jgi:hypothetical protein